MTKQAATLPTVPAVVVVPDLLAPSTFYVFNADKPNAEPLGPLNVPHAWEALREARKAWPDVLNLRTVGKDERGASREEVEHYATTKAAALAVLKSCRTRANFRIMGACDAHLPGDVEHYLPGVVSAAIHVSRGGAVRFIDDAFRPHIEKRGAALRVRVSVGERREKWDDDKRARVPYGSPSLWVYIG
jgi:hypothetical protein